MFGRLAAVFVGFIADFEMGNVAIAKEAGTAKELTGCSSNSKKVGY